MSTDTDPAADARATGDTPLPVTMQFVMGIGAFILVAWIAMFFLMRARW